MPALLVMRALGQFVTRVTAGDAGVEIGGVIRQQAPAHHLFFLPHIQQAQLGLVQWIFLGCQWIIQALGQDLLKGIPEVLGAEALALGWDAPSGMQNGAAIPVGPLGFGTRLADAINGRQQ